MKVLWNNPGEHWFSGRGTYPINTCTAIWRGTSTSTPISSEHFENKHPLELSWDHCYFSLYDIRVHASALLRKKNNLTRKFQMSASTVTIVVIHHRVNPFFTQPNFHSSGSQHQRINCRLSSRMRMVHAICFYYKVGPRKSVKGRGQGWKKLVN